MVRLGPAWTTQQDRDSKMNYNTMLNISLKRFTLFIFTYCVCALANTSQWMAYKNKFSLLMSSGKQTQASKQLAPLPTELSSA